MLTDERLAEIRARCDAATPGLWEVIVKGNTVQSHAIPGVCSGISPKSGNAAFVAHARADIPALLAEVERLRQERDDLAKEHFDCPGHFHVLQEIAENNGRLLIAAKQERDAALAEVATVTDRQDWCCKSEGCRFPLGAVIDGVLRPYVVPESVDGRGVARFRCPRSGCGRVKVWQPTPAAACSRMAAGMI